jgi:hypothetical protein
MKIEDQVCTVEQAKKLKELGVDNDSYFSYIGDDTPETYWQIYSDQEGRTEVGSGWYQQRLPAFTVSELGLMLPPETCTWFDGTHWHCSTVGHDNPIHCVGLTEVKARAEELISCLTHRSISIEEVNQRLKAA